MQCSQCLGGGYDSAVVRFRACRPMGSFRPARPIAGVNAQFDWRANSKQGIATCSISQSLFMPDLKIQHTGQRGVAVEAVESGRWCANGLLEFVKLDRRICIGEGCPDKVSRKNQFSLLRPRIETWFLKPFSWTSPGDDTALCCIKPRILKAATFSRVCAKQETLETTNWSHATPDQKLLQSRLMLDDDEVN